MAQLLYYSVEGLAGRREVLKHDFDPALNVFWGVNGAGKTTLLKILDAALSNDAARISNSGFERATVGFFAEGLGATIERTITREALDGLLDEHSSFGRPRLPRSSPSENRIPWESRLIEGDPDSPLGASYRHQYLSVNRRIEPRNIRHSYDFDDEDEFTSQIERAWRIFNSRSLTRIRQIQQRGLADVLADLLHTQSPEAPLAHPSTIEAGEAYEAVTNFLQQQGIPTLLSRDKFSERFKTDEALPGVVQRIRGVNGDIEAATQPQESFKNIINDLYSGDKRIEFNNDSTIQFMTGRRKLELRSLSSGEKQLLHILLSTLSSERSPIIIDEPELSMHLDWQQDLLGAMQAINPASQIILATHSPEIIASVGREFVFEL